MEEPMDDGPPEGAHQENHNVDNGKDKSPSSSKPGLSYSMGETRDESQVMCHGTGTAGSIYKKKNRRQINLYRMFFADFSVNSQPLLLKFCKD